VEEKSRECWLLLRPLVLMVLYWGYCSEVDMADIYRLIQDVTGLGETGETLVGKKK